MTILIALLAGLSMGIFFYAGLWLTVRMLMTTRHPALLVLSSFWARTLIVLAGFLFTTNGRWQNALASLAGFGLGRLIIARLLPRTEGHSRCT